MRLKRLSFKNAPRPYSVDDISQICEDVPDYSLLANAHLSFIEKAHGIKYLYASLEEHPDE